MKIKTLKLDSSKVNIFFTSDTHFGHRNIIAYTNRPFSDVTEMDRVIIDKWNEVVGDNDIIFHLGDFTLLGTKSWAYYLSQLKGTKYLIAGNHDKSITEKMFAGVFTQLNLLIMDEEIQDGQRITLNHYPMYSWYQSHRGAWHLFGHVHGTLKFSKDNHYPPPSAYDVGVDNNNFTPISYQEVKTIITRQMLSFA